MMMKYFEFQKKLMDAFLFAFFWHLGFLIGGVPIDIRPLFLFD